MDKIVKQTDVLTTFLWSVAPTKGDTPPAVQPELKVEEITATGTTFAVGSKGDKSFILILELSIDNPNYTGVIVLFYNAYNKTFTKLHGWPSSSLYPYGRFVSASLASGIVNLDFGKKTIYIPKESKHYIIYLE